MKVKDVVIKLVKHIQELDQLGMELCGSREKFSEIEFEVLIGQVICAKQICSTAYSFLKTMHPECKYSFGDAIETKILPLRVIKRGLNEREN